MSRKESKFCAINFINLWIDFFKNKILTTCVMKTRIQKVYKEDKWNGRKCVQGL